MQPAKAAVYEAALQLIARGVSPAAMTIQQLADTAGIGKGTVYGYFSSKEEILQGLAEYCFARENERIRVLFADMLHAGRAGGADGGLFAGHCRQPDGRL